MSAKTPSYSSLVADNIAMGRPGATRPEIVAAVKAAYAHEFISGFDRGYDSPCGEHGMQLSGGQRQRIAIARAIIKDAPIILLDGKRPLRGYSENPKRIVQKALHRLCVGRTTLVVAHRLSTIVNADRIYVLEDGQVTETGTHTQLMEIDGHYRRLQQVYGEREPQLNDA